VETVTLIGPRGRIEHVRLIGPPRDRDQVEIARSDEFVLGVDAPVRLSGDLEGSPGIVVEGPVGRVQLASGLICARRHIHMSSEDSQGLGMHDGERVSVRLGRAGRQVVYRNVPVRVSSRFATELHLDTDEANAAAVSAGDEAQILLHDADTPQ
jgi:propanediol utilization protein